MRPGIICAAVLVIVAACAAPAPAAAPLPSGAPKADASAAAWNTLIEAAKKEGQLTIVGGPEGSVEDGPWYDAFSRQYGIKVALTGGSAAEVTTRLLAERAQGVYTADISSQGDGGSKRFFDAKIFDPIADQLVNPEAVDRSTGWSLSRPFWGDTDQKFCQYAAIRALPNLGQFFYNSAKVTPAEIASIKSYQDLLDPKWKGRIIIGDIAAGEADRDRTIMWQTLGQKWFDALFRQQAVRVSLFGDERTYADAVARGDAHIALFPPGSDSLKKAGTQGLPVQELVRTLSEGAPRAGGQRVCLMKNAPHPNAAKLFINWAFMRDGQRALNQFTHRTDRASLRSDVPQGKIGAELWQRARANGPFVDDASPEYVAALDASTKFLKSIYADLRITPGR